MIASVLPTYSRAPMTFVKGEGSWLIEADGRRFLDLGAGIAVNALGHAHPALVKALTDQAGALWHTSNLYHIPQQQMLADKLVDATFADTVFFTNSGTEACELAVKMARKYWYDKGQEDRVEIITFDGSFHGRSSAGIAAAGSEKMTKGFGPLLGGFTHLTFGDHDALTAAASNKTAAIMVEPIQGEGGIRSLPDQCLKGLRDLCDEHGILLILDEVQCGVGRTGKLFAHEWAGVEPDIMMVAKGIGGGFPLGAVLATEDAASGMTAGTHGSTYGGNPLGCAVGCAVLDEINTPEFLAEVNRKSGLLRQKLEGLIASNPDVFESVRGAGMMMGVKCKATNIEVVNAGYDAHVLTVPAADNVIRLLPALTITDEEIGEAVTRLNQVLDIHKTDPAALRTILDDALAMKSARKGLPRATLDAKKPLDGHMVALIFEKPSTRTRVSFDVGVRQMGGETMVLSGSDMQLGHGETIADTARVLSRYVDLIMIRTFDESVLLEMAEYADVPVINGLTDRTHPCQIMADVMTYEEHRGPIKGKKVVWFGDGNNVCASFLHAAAQFQFDLTFAGPAQLDPEDEFVGLARRAGCTIQIERDADKAVAGADLVVADTWVSMHDSQSTKERRHNQLRPYQVNQELMSKANDNALFMHCLPAHREEEVTSEVMDGPNSVIFDEAENRLHAQKAIMRYCLDR